MAIQPSELSPAFIKKIENKYGPVTKDDFFGDDLKIYYKADKPEERKEGGGITHTIINLPSFVNLFKNLGKSKNAAKSLKTKPELRGDTEYQKQADKVIDTFNSFRTFFRTNYPDQYSLVKNSIKEIEGMGYNTPFAFKKKGSKPNISSYTSIGYEPVDRKALRKKAKGIDYIDLYKD